VALACFVLAKLCLRLASIDPSASRLAPAQGTVLVVEESRDVAEVTPALLEQLGYRVVRAENAAEAPRHLQRGIGVDLLLSDIVMPGGIDGLALHKSVASGFPSFQCC